MTSDIFQFVARNADIADTHTFARDHRSAINSALHRAGLPTMGKARTMGDLREIVFGAEVVATRPERTTAPIAQAAPVCGSLFVDASRGDERCERDGKAEYDGRCGYHKAYASDVQVIARREEVEAQRQEALARKEAREMLAEFATA